MMNWLRNNVYASGVLLLLRLYIGWKWASAGWGKITGGFDASGFMKGAIAKPVTDKATNELLYPTYHAFLESVALPGVKAFNFLVPWGEFLVGLGLILGGLTAVAATFGLLMNFMYMFAGTVSSNPWMILLGFFVAAAGANAGRFGLDYYLLPYLASKAGRKRKAVVFDKDNKPAFEHG